MVRYLSAAWFDLLRSHPESAGAPSEGPVLVLRHVVGAGADGEHRHEATAYDVVIAGDRASIRHPASGAADLTFTTDYPTAAAIAGGRLSTHAALAEGRLRVAGDVSVLARRADDVAGLDPVPPALRAETEF